MFLFQTIFGPTVANQSVSELKTQLLELCKQANPDERTKLANTVSTTISSIVSDKSFALNSEAAYFCKAATNLLKQLKYDTKGLDALLGSKNIPVNDIADKKAQNYISNIQHFKLSQRAIDLLTETMDGLLQNGNRTEGALLTFGFKSKENLGNFIASLNAKSGYSFKIDFYESELRTLEVDDKKQEMLEYIQNNKYSVLASYLSGKAEFGDKNQYKFKDISEYRDLANNVFANTQDRFGAYKYVEVSNKFAVSFRLSPDASKTATNFIGPAIDDMGAGFKTFKTNREIIKSAEVDVAKELLAASNSKDANHESEQNHSNIPITASSQLSYGRQFVPSDPDSKYDAEYFVDEQSIRPLAGSLRYDFEGIVKEMRENKTYGKKLAKYNDLAVFLASEKGQEFASVCRQKKIKLEITGTATMEMVFTGYNIEEFLREAEGNYQLALQRAKKGTEYLDNVHGEVLEIAKLTGISGPAFIDYSPVGKVYFFQDSVPTKEDMELYDRQNYLQQFLKSKKITGVKDIGGLLARYGFDKDKAADNFDNFMHDLHNLSDKNSKDCYDKLLKGPVAYDSKNDRYTAKKDAASLKLLHNYFLTTDQGGMRTETPSNGFVRAETRRNGRAVEVSVIGDYDIGVKITGAKDNGATLKLKYGVNGLTMVPDIGKNVRAQVYFYDADADGGNGKLYTVPPGAVGPASEKADAEGYYSYPIKLEGENAYLYDGQTKVQIPEDKVLNGRFIAYSETTDGQLTTKPVWASQEAPEYERTTPQVFPTRREVHPGEYSDMGFEDYVYKSTIRNGVESDKVKKPTDVRICFATYVQGSELPVYFISGYQSNAESEPVYKVSGKQVVVDRGLKIGEKEYSKEELLDMLNNGAVGVLLPGKTTQLDKYLAFDGSTELKIDDKLMVKAGVVYAKDKGKVPTEQLQVVHLSDPSVLLEPTNTFRMDMLMPNAIVLPTENVTINGQEFTPKQIKKLAEEGVIALVSDVNGVPTIFGLDGANIGPVKRRSEIMPDLPGLFRRVPRKEQEAKQKPGEEFAFELSIYTPNDPNGQDISYIIGHQYSEEVARAIRKTSR